MFTTEITQKAHNLSKQLRQRQLKMVAAESCTGGLVSAAMVEIPGASEVFERGYVSYSNEAKIELLTVPTFYIEEYGAVSMQTAVAMAEGALLMSKGDISVAITGVAGPEGGTEDKPIGTVFIASAFKNHETIHARHFFSGSRHLVRSASVEAALDMLIARIS